MLVRFCGVLFPAIIAVAPFPSQAVKKLLPAGPLQPKLPAETKRAWHLDKQSLRGIKKRRTGAAASAAEAEAEADADAAADVVGI